MELIKKYFPELSQTQLDQFSSLQKLYADWNEKINVISRKDIDGLYERHVLHSLAIAKFIALSEGSKILDVGTGGGFPGIPLAIFFPEVKFHLVDSIGKKIKVVNEIVSAIDLKNVSSEKNRVEEMEGEFDFIVSRAVAPMKTIYHWSKDLISAKSRNEIRNGWILLKGGELQNEIDELGKRVSKIQVADFFSEEFFKEKFIIFFH